MSILLVGTGPMARNYAPVLNSMNHTTIAIGRDASRAAEFQNDTKITTITGNIADAVNKHGISTAIVVVPTLSLAAVTIELINAGVKKILVEKPGAANLMELKELNLVADQNGADVYIAYNRRFFASAIKAREIIAEDLGAQLITFNFTELSDKIESLNYPRRLTENIFFNNSVHVVDLALSFGELPEDVFVSSAGELPWHSKGATFAGHAKTTSGLLYSFCADWRGGGRWAVEVSTKNRRLILCPLEKLQVQDRGSFQLRDELISDGVDSDYKPGLYRMVESFVCINPKQSQLPSLASHIKNTEMFYEKICPTT